MNARIDPADYVLGELDPRDLAEAERLMQTDRGFRERVQRLRPVVDELQALPPEAWEGLEPPPLRGATSPRSEIAGRRPRRFVLRPAVAVAACVALLAVGGGIGYLASDEGSPVESTAEVVELEPVSGQDTASSGTARLDAAAGQATVRVTGLPASRDSEYYELWLLSGPDKLISLGSFRVPASGATEVNVPLPVDPQLFRYVDLSVERLGGGPGHSGISLLRAPT